MVPGEGFVDLALIAMKGLTGCGEAANFVRQRHDCGDRVKYKQSVLFVRNDCFFFFNFWVEGLFGFDFLEV